MYKRYIKRILDIVLCGIALVVLSPIFLITAIAIKISSSGPVFYHSERTGKNHKKFNFYKFRSMHITNADKHMFIADGDRLFPVGKIIRRLKIDELPQLINVIKGDMSIVGPRPMPYASVDRTYAGKYQRILTVRPGLTSAASLYDYTVGDTYTDNEAYKRDILPKKNALELLYVQKESFSYDTSLVWRTIVTIIAVAIHCKKYPSIPELEGIKNEV
jgi:lipopolysaccharide/colanic/teichoic acid biosynthesis glycosyltransferase